MWVISRDTILNPSISQLSDGDLLAETARAVADERRCTASLLELLDEDARSGRVTTVDARSLGPTAAAMKPASSSSIT
jgi:hypothetical protein